MPPPPLFSRTGQWLSRNPKVAHAMLWMRWPYPGWSESRKRQLRRAVDKILDDGDYPDQDDPPDNIQRYQAGENLSSMTLRKADAWCLYLSHIAHSLAMEIRGEFGWSLRHYTPGNLRQLLASQSFFEYRFGRRGYSLESPAHGTSLPSAPQIMIGFMRARGLIQNSRKATILRLLEWSSAHLSHFLGATTPANFHVHWQYRGFSPVSRILAGTNNGTEFAHHIAGCHGHYGFLKAMLRTANIPVMNERVGLRPHALPWFPSEELFMSHGDDPYSQLFRTLLEPLPVESLLINRTRWHHWFGAPLTQGERGLNVGRQLRELGRHHLNWFLLRMHCQDLAEHKSHEESQVYHDFFQRQFSVQRLEADGLWARMDAKLAEIGGCSNLPPT